jgi:hypothetical protein
MCNLYSITTNQAAIINLFRVINRYVGNLAPMPGVFQDYPAPVICNAAEIGSGVRFHGHPVAVRLPRVARIDMRRGGPSNQYELHRAKRQSESVRNPRRIQLLISQLFRLLSLEFFCDSFHDAA